MIGLCNGCIRCRDERLRGRVCVLDRSLSSDLCHDRCACMAGHKNTLIKKQKRFFGLEGRLHGVLPRVSPSVVWCVICVVLSLLCFIFRSPAHPSMLDRGQQRRPNLSRPSNGLYSHYRWFVGVWLLEAISSMKPECFYSFINQSRLFSITSCLVAGRFKFC
ncbi:hypothetical protein PRUPE_7G154100 [Prunus persica]|uniref:Uncharacterized protein n=1 Tax=Prunus persica TaxID=3760 RepID=A0A251NBU8_PRUPE|nr:hypothetical protein PRUPE_7G154100 [Prunus persica]ONH96821.1 hypothetical protein PRUPE_7G154100 [Prunus persica]